ncbi:sigma 54-interacting transcriptional regulator [Desulfobacterales bacterium HSG17]|nr:sigma 54-interacting transcriptional regulator [Desulfobacterales bacterium HSG17]
MQSILKNYQLILECIEEGVFTVNREWKIMSFNRAAEKITGFMRKEVIGRTCAEVFRTNVCDNGCILRKTIQTELPQTNRAVIITRADGRKVPISINTTVLRASDGTLIGGVEIFRDLSALTQYKKAVLKEHTFADIISKNDKMLRYFKILPQIAESDSTVLIDGPTGTGKEILARAIHNHSTRPKGPFVAVNCGALPDTLIESELFGYKAGAFTDAKKDKPGRFKLAQNGTIFLDEIGDISPAVQVRLLRVLQEHTFEPLGGRKSEKTNARVIAATHHDLEKLVKKSKFREDLFYRINVIKISLPPLCDRKEDIPLLVEHFVEQFNQMKGKHILSLSHEAMTALMMYGWPGNIRELENAIEHGFVLCPNDLIRLPHLPERVHPPIQPLTAHNGITLKEIEKTAIIRSLKRNQGKKVATAKELGIDKNTLRRKLMRFGVLPEEYS